MSENKKTQSKLKVNKGEAASDSGSAREHASDTQGRTNDAVNSGGLVLHPNRIRAASDSSVPPGNKASREKSVITQTSSLDGHKLASPRNSGEKASGSLSPSAYPPQLLQLVPPVMIRTFSGRHRQSGLFSKDDLSVDLSVRPSEICLATYPDQTGTGQIRSGSVIATPGGGPSQSGAGEGEKRYPISMAGSSIGSSSLGGSAIFSENMADLGRKEIYKPFRRKWRRFRRKYKGCIFALLSSLTSSLASYFVRELTETGHYSPSYCLLWRYFGVFFPGIFIILYYRFCHGDMVFDTIWPLKEKETAKRFGLSVVRAIVDVGAVFLNYKAFEYLLQSETSTILNSKPIVVQLLAHYTLGEPWGVVPIIMSVVAAIGVVVMSRPPFLLSEQELDNSEHDFVKTRLPGVLLCGGSMLLSSIVYCILRYLKDVHYSVFSLFIGAAGLIFGVGMTFGLDQFVIPKSWQDWSYFTAVAVLVCFSSIAIVIALQNEEAFVVSLVRSFDVVFSFIWEMCINNEFPDVYRGGGAVIILFCVVVIFFRKYLTHQSSDSRVYKMLSFLTK